MEPVVDVVNALLNSVLVVFVVATMLSAGLRTEVSALVGVLRNGLLVVLVLLANLVVVPLLGLAVGKLFALASAGLVALVLVASSPGAPFGAKMAMIQKGDVVTGSVLQVVLAAIGSLTFPITANLLLGWADLGDDLSIPVGRLVLSVAVLQLVPFAVGLAMRAWAPGTAAAWMPPVARASNLAFVGVLALGVLGSWQQIVDLIGSRTLLAALVFTAAGVAVGWALSVGSGTTRTTTALIAPTRNAGPAFAAIAIAFGNDPAILAAVSGILLIGLAVELPVASWLARRRTPAETHAAERAAADDAQVAELGHPGLEEGRPSRESRPGPESRPRPGSDVAQSS
jgi:bile acid:Na+ symporter, BASS family